jgi:hypothetical protein
MPSRGSTFSAVLAAVRRGQTIAAASRSLGVSEDLAEAMVDEARRLGLVVSAREACAGPQGSLSCLGCPIAAGDVGRGTPH